MHNNQTMEPGPASLEVEHSPRNFCPQGDRGLNLAEDFLFSGRAKN